MRPARLLCLLLPFAACAPTIADDDATADDDSTAADDDTTTGDDDSVGDDDATGDDDIIGDDDIDDPCAGVLWQELGADPSEWSNVLDGFTMSADALRSAAAGGWRGDLSWISPGTDPEVKLSVMSNPGTFSYRPGNGEACIAAMEIPISVQVQSTSCELAQQGQATLFVLAGEPPTMSSGAEIPWADVEGSWVPDFDPTEWDTVTLGLITQWVLPPSELGDPAVLLDIQISASRELDDGMGEGMVGFVGDATLRNTEGPGTPAGWTNCWFSEPAGI
jgi:hypothetical protein